MTLTQDRAHQLLSLILTQNNINTGTICYIEPINRDNFVQSDFILKINSKILPKKTDNTLIIVPDIKNLSYLPDFAQLVHGYDDHIKSMCPYGGDNFITYLPVLFSPEIGKLHNHVFPQSLEQLFSNSDFIDSIHDEFDEWYEEHMVDDPRNFLTFVHLWGFIHHHMVFDSAYDYEEIPYDTGDVVGYFNTCNGVGQEFRNQSFTVGYHEFNHITKPSEFLISDVSRQIKLPAVII